MRALARRSCGGLSDAQRHARQPAAPEWVLRKRSIALIAMLLYLGSYFDPRQRRERGGGAVTSSGWAAKVDGHTIPTHGVHR
mgnify:CR=1 FL=1